MMTICILTAGRGTRMGRHTQKINKALLPLNGKAILSRIIELFPEDSEFVIALGHLGDQVREYLSFAHPRLKVQFVQVDRYQGLGSGPGYSLLCCEAHLQKPFYFVSCDTLWDEPISENLNQNWVGVAQVPETQSASYCNFGIQDGVVRAIYDKQMRTAGDSKAFIGLAYFQDYATFWSGLRSKKLVKGELQISNGIQSLIQLSPVLAREFHWTDVGTETQYNQLLQSSQDFNFSKTDEQIYFIHGKVIKFFSNPAYVQGRVLRAKKNPSVFPKLVDVGNQFYSYKMEPGQTFYSCGSPPLFKKLLLWLSHHLWTPVKVTPEEFRNACQKFYHDKTQERVQAYLKKYNLKDRSSLINGIRIPGVRSLLEEVDWKHLQQGLPTFFHGDLQFDNILLNEKTEDFLLLDWRQDFAGSIDYGDLYYDLAKLYGGIILNYDTIKKGLMRYSNQGSSIEFDFAQRFQSRRYIKILESFILKMGWDLSQVKTLVGLIYLNMAPLHEPPFDQLLFALGRSFLYKQLRTKIQMPPRGNTRGNTKVNTKKVNQE